jgi:omega-amidase
MKISIIQPDLDWEDKASNLTKLEKLLLPLNNVTDVVILPEMFNTGFSMNPHKLCESPRDKTLLWMKNIAGEGNFGICGSYIVKENIHYYNRFVFVSTEKEIWQYDKRHLFSIAGEDKLFTPGNKRLTFEYSGIRMSPYICYDLRFPVWSRNRNDCDLIIYSANWPESRREVWIILLKARAIENQCYVAGVNRTGTDGEGIKYCGDSMIIDPRGRIIASVNSGEEGSVTAEISMTELSDFRSKFPVFKDSDDFTINF